MLCECDRVAYELRQARLVYVFFFFSSRRRHTRFDCDWSSDVCSSDLPQHRRVLLDEGCLPDQGPGHRRPALPRRQDRPELRRSEEHTSELQSQSNLVCRLLLEKKTKSPPILNGYSALPTTCAMCRLCQ